jgi:ABC-type Mn2+/Zn2+ transport system ATPase subunit
MSKSCDPNSAGGKAAVRLEGVCAAANGTAIIAEVSVCIPEGSFMLVLGPNGAGKTTFLRLVAGLMKPAAGTVLVFGRDLGGSDTKRLRSQIAYVPQGSPVDARIPISVGEVVEIGRLAHKGLLGKLTENDRSLCLRAMETVGISHLAHNPFGHLSEGQKQKVSLARALAQEASLMLLDEPLNNLDPKAQADVCRTIDRIYGSGGRTIMMVTHFLERIPASATGAILMRGGRVTGCVGIDNIREDGFRKELYASLSDPELGVR